MRAALYARVSTEEQVEGYSIDAQRRAFQTLCQSKGWSAHDEYIEEGNSARTEDINKRPIFKRMVADALAGKFDVLVVHKLDRFSRNLRITLEYFDKLLKTGVTFVSINEQMKRDREAKVQVEAQPTTEQTEVTEKVQAVAEAETIAEKPKRKHKAKEPVAVA